MTRTRAAATALTLIALLGACGPVAADPAGTTDQTAAARPTPLAASPVAAGRTIGSAVAATAQP